MTTVQIIELALTSGIALGIIKLIFSAGKISQSFKSINEKIDGISSDILEIKRDVASLNTRLSRLEGAFYERGYWESRKTGTQEKK